MNFIIKNLFLLCLIIAITGCAAGPKFKSYQINEKQFYQNNKSIIITKLIHKYKFLGFERESNVDFVISKVDANYIDITKRHSYKFPADLWLSSPDLWLGEFFEFYVAMVDPGEYVLENLKYVCGNVTYVSTLNGLVPSPNGEKYVYGKFYVAPGEIVYLGNINVSFANKQSILLIEDKYEEAAKYLISKYPSFRLENIKKRFMSVNSVKYKKKRSRLKEV